MIIPSQLPQIVTVPRSGALQALALQAGQMVDGRVVGPAANGGTQVRISGQLLNLILPQAAKVGETLRFEVQGGGAQLRLALQPSSSGPSLIPVASGAPASGTPAPGAAPAPIPTAPASGPSTTPQPQTVASATPGGSPVAALPSAAPAPVAALPIAGTPSPQGVAPAGAAPPTASGAAVQPATGAAPLPNTAPAAPAASAVPRAATRYPQSASPTPAAPTAATVAATALPQAGATVAAAASVPPPLPSTPQAALAQMVQTALPQQNSVVSLTAAFTDIAGKIALPEPVARAAQQVLANQVNITGKFDGSSLQKAFMSSGVFQEATLARPGAPAPVPQTDMKTAMLALRQTLTTWLGQQPPVIAAVSQIAPPLRGKFPRVSAPNIPPIDPASGAEEIGKHLLERTEAALSRVRLHQHASLPDPAVKGSEWSADLPVIIGGQQTLLQLQIHGEEQGPGDDPNERGWQMRFAINLPGLGEVGAQVSLRGSATGVMLWAAERGVSDALETDIDGLRASLTGAGLAPGAVIVRHGAPPPSQLPSNAGHFVDARR